MIIARSVPGWRLPDEPLLHTVLFYADTFVGMALLTLAVAVEPTDSEER